MKRYGYDVLKNRLSWMSWMRRECMLPYGWHDEPTQYPCIAKSLLNSSEDSYPEYIYLETIETMRKALEKEES